MRLAVVMAAAFAVAAGVAEAGRPNSEPTAKTVTNASTTILAGATGQRTFLSIKNESATATIACNFGGTAVANTAGNYTIGPGQVEVWGPFPFDFPMSGAPINCISSAATSPATIESNP